MKRYLSKILMIISIRLGCLAITLDGDETEKEMNTWGKRKV